jgi:hypothetical protein
MTNKIIGERDSFRFISSVSINAKISSVSTHTQSFSKKNKLATPNNRTQTNESGEAKTGLEIQYISTQLY